MEDFVTYEQAVQLKELGFDWGCYHYYYKDDKKLCTYSSIGYGDDCRNWNDEYNSAIGDSECSAPTLAQAQKWLREKEIEVGVFAKYDGEIRTGKWMWLMRKFDTHLFDTIFSEDVSYDTYEEALSIGINQALELLKEKK